MRKLGVVSQQLVPFQSGGLEQVVLPTVDVGHSYNKQHACYYCGLLQKKISRHLRMMHSKEQIVVEMTTKVQSAQMAILEELRLMGDFQHNMQVSLHSGQHKIIFGALGQQNFEAIFVK
jgi:hypothetical protein